jgi:hypothetical protein
VDVAGATRAAGLDPACLDELPRAAVPALLDAVFEHDLDPTLGLRIGTRIKPELCGVVGLDGPLLARCEGPQSPSTHARPNRRTQDGSCSDRVLSTLLESRLARFNWS